MSEQHSRREVLRGGLAAATVGMLGVPDWVLPALAQGATVVPFLEFPETFNANPAPDRRLYDTRTLQSFVTPKDQFFTTQHYGHPVLDEATFKLYVGGLVNTPKSYTIADLKKMPKGEVMFGFECSGNRAPVQGLCSNGKWTGVPLAALLKAAGLKADGREVVFLGADHGTEEVEWRTQKYSLDQQFGRSLPRDKAMSAEPLVAYAYNDEPLTRHQGFPLRLIVPGYYGVANVKWLSEIQVQSDPYMGKYQARWYRTVRGEMINGEMKWMENAVTAMRLKSFVARVTKEAGGHKMVGVILNDGTPIKSVEVQIDGGAWQPATMDKQNTKYSWKLFHYDWKGATPGEHTIVSRATDINGVVQPTEKELENKKSFLEHNAQHPRRVMIA
ncbi:molybdopterin-dependent oxidoreductase [Luteitalea sp.]|uniref:molybdopterin-dependent oxidoreductase n=1 Tax=Luteitalea sp. TaxID=2004800 RepID=UPI0025BCFD01|nr:molybdopterin-dependent oxidoreductase [Luteitalea sp.]